MPPRTAPARPMSWGRAPDLKPIDEADDDEDDHDQVEQIHGASMDEPAPGGGAGSLSGRRERCLRRR